MLKVFFAIKLVILCTIAVCKVVYKYEFEKLQEIDDKRQTPVSLINQTKTDNKVKTAKSTNNLPNSTNDSKKPSPSSIVNDVNSEDKDSEENTNHLNRVIVNNEVSLKSQAEAVSSESLGSTRSTDTGVSVNTVRGVSSAEEKTGLHLIKRSEEIETLSGNIVHISKSGEER
jgi:hypothetical protein